MPWTLREQAGVFLTKARPRGTLVLAAIIKASRKLRVRRSGQGRGPINLSLEIFFGLAPTLCHFNVQIFRTAKYACFATYKAHETTVKALVNGNFFLRLRGVMISCWSWPLSKMVLMGVHSRYKGLNGSLR